jgi:hypothetical protein
MPNRRLIIIGVFFGGSLPGFLGIQIFRQSEYWESLVRSWEIRSNTRK